MASGLALIGFLCLWTQAQEADPASREWSQSRGGPAGTSAVDVAPITSEPEVAWHVSFREIESDPVGWGGTVYLVATQTSGRKLFALDLAKGEWAATPLALPAGGRVHLAVWEGFVAAVERDGITVFQHHGKQLTASREKKIAGTFPAPACVAKGFLFASDDRGTGICVDLRTGKKVGLFGGGAGRPVVVAGPIASDLIVATATAGTPPPPDEKHVYLGTHLGIARTRMSGFDSKAPKFATPETSWHGEFESETLQDKELAGTFLARVQGSGEGAASEWLAYSPAAIKRAGGGSGWHTLLTPKYLAPISTEPAVFRDTACGFADDGALVAFHSDGKHRYVVPKDQPLPAGARRGRATIARDVLYLENWAVEIESGRVLWCKPDLEPVSPLIPIADDRALYTTKAGELVCLRGTGAGSSEAPAAAAATAASRPSLPGSGDGVVTTEGRRIEGKVVELQGGRVRVEGKKAGGLELAAADVALVESGGAVEVRGEAYPICRAFESALGAAAVEAFDKAFEGYRRVGFFEDCQRLMAEVRGYDESAAAAMEKRLSGVSASKSGNASLQLERLKKEEAAMRAEIADSYRRASDWSKGHGLPLAAAALLLQAERVLPGRPSVLEEAGALVPAGFVARDGEPRAISWMRLAKEVLPVSGALLPADAPEWEKVREAPWRGGALGMRTRDVVLLSTELDPVIVGSCLRRGERAIRVLEKLFGATAAGAAAEPLQVVLHKDRDEYQAASAAAGYGKQEWTAGFYSPMENLSRFFVPRGKGDGGPRDRDLDHVLVHELCHHYIAARRWGGAKEGKHGDPARPGFWIVEGIADFVAEQVVEMDRRGERFDDETVTAIDASARLLEAGKLVPAAQLVDLSQIEFAGLGPKPVASLQLRHTLGRLEASATNRFYEESASLVFYLVNRCGPERRKAVMDYLDAWHAGSLEKGSWAKLGFQSAEQLESGYVAFLRESGH